MKKLLTVFLVLILATAVLSGCKSKDKVSSDTVNSGKKTELKDGTYSAKFTSDNAMFHVNETKDGRGKLTVKDGSMTIHVTLVSKKIVNLYPGLKKDAEKEGAELIKPTIDKVKYDDGYVEEVYGFDVPVPAIDEEFPVALIGTKGKWYDHKVIVTDPKPLNTKTAFKDGTYSIELRKEGGTGRAKVTSPALVTIKNGKVIAVIEWDSPYYDYMIVDGKKYKPTFNKEGNSVFNIPVKNLDKPLKVKADTTAMSKPHEIEYTLTFKPNTAKKK